MAITRTLIKAIPHVPGGDLRKQVESWELTMSFQNGVSGDSDFLYKEYSGHCPNGYIINTLGESKPAADFTRAELESLCLIEEWSTDFHSLTATPENPPTRPDTTYSLPS